MHICVGSLTIIGSDNGLSPGRRQAITWTNVGILLIGPLGTNLSEMLIEIHTFSFKRIHLKMSSGKWRPFCLGLNVLMSCYFRSVAMEWLPFGSKASNWTLTYCGLVTPYHLWRHRSVSTLAQVMGCCLLAPSHYLFPYYQWGPVALIWVQFHKRYLSHQFLNIVWKLLI